MAADRYGVSIVDGPLDERGAFARLVEIIAAESARLRDLAALDLPEPEPVEEVKRAVTALAEASFRAGYDAGWESSGEGHNAEWTNKRFTAEAYERAVVEARAARK